MDTIRQSLNILHKCNDNSQISESLEHLCTDTTKHIETLTNKNFNEILFNINHYGQLLKISKQPFDLTIIDKIIFNEKFTHINDVTLISLCSNNAGLYKVMNDLEKTKPSLNQLLLACECPFVNVNDRHPKQYNIYLIQRILEHKIIPTHECFEKLFSDPYYTEIYHITFHNSNNFNDLEQVKDVIDLLTAFGLTLNLKDAKILAKSLIDVNIGKFDIVPDKELIDICLSNHFLPQYIDNVKINQFQLRDLFLPNLKNKLSYYASTSIKQRVLTVKMLDDFITKHNLKYDVICLQNACKSGNLEVITYLIDEQHIAPDSWCLRYVKESFGYNYPIVKKISDMVN